MEITLVGWGCGRKKNELVQLQRQLPAFKSQFQSRSPLGMPSFTRARRSCRLRHQAGCAAAAALPTSIYPIYIPSRKSLTLTPTPTPCRRALLDDTTASPSSSYVEEVKRVAEPHPSLTLKKRATEMGPEWKGTSVFLVGINSSIKSNLGKLLAEALRYYYFDSDELIETAAGGKSTARLVIEQDEDFRESETEVLKQLSSMSRLVVSAGNGAVQCAANLALLRHGISVWIDVPLDMVAREVMEDDIQLRVSELTISGSYSEVLTQLTQLYKRSQSGYTAADSTVSLSKVASTLGYEDLVEVTVEDMALEVLKELQKLTRVKKMMEAATRPF